MYSHLMNKCVDTIDMKCYTFCVNKLSRDVVDAAINKYHQGYSIDELKRTLGVSRNMFTGVLCEHGVKIRTLKDASNSDIRKTKYVNTVLTQYGVDNVSKLDAIKQKKS